MGYSHFIRSLKPKVLRLHPRAVGHTRSLRTNRGSGDRQSLRERSPAHRHGKHIERKQPVESPPGFGMRSRSEAQLPLSLSAPLDLQDINFTRRTPTFLEGSIRGASAGIDAIPINFSWDSPSAARRLECAGLRTLAISNARRCDRFAPADSAWAVVKKLRADLSASRGGERKALYDGAQECFSFTCYLSRCLWRFIS